MDYENNVSCFIDNDEFLVIFYLLFPNYETIISKNPDSNRLPLKKKLKSLFSNQVQDTLNALRKLELILLRSAKRNPLSVILTHTLIKDYCQIKSKKLDTEDIQKLLCFDLLRAVSQITDQYHSKTFKNKEKKTMKNILKTIDMKEFGVITELRHSATHRILPSLIILKNCLFYLIFWLFKRFWICNYKKIIKLNQENKKSFAKNLDYCVIRKEIRKNFFEILIKQSNFEEFSNFLKKFDKIDIEILAYFLSEIFKILLKLNIGYSSYLLLKEKQINVKRQDKINEICLEALREIVFKIKNLENEDIQKIFEFPFIRFEILKIFCLENISVYFSKVKEIFKFFVSDFLEEISFENNEKKSEQPNLTKLEEIQTKKKFKKLENYVLEPIASIYRSQQKSLN